MTWNSLCWIFFFKWCLWSKLNQLSAQKKEDSEYCNDKKLFLCEFLWTKSINNQISDFQIEQNIQARATGVRCVSVWEPWIKHPHRAGLPLLLQLTTTAVKLFPCYLTGLAGCNVHAPCLARETELRLTRSETLRCKEPLLSSLSAASGNSRRKISASAWETAGISDCVIFVLKADPAVLHHYWTTVYD